MKQAWRGWLAGLSCGWVLGCGGSEPPPVVASARQPEPVASAAVTAPAVAREGAAPAPAASSASAPAVAPAVGPGPSQAPVGAIAETRTMEVIADVVKANRQAMRDCYEKTLKELPGLRGTLTVHFVIDPKGVVTRAEPNAERTTLKAGAVAACVVEAVKKLSFPPSSAGMETTVNYPFDFKP